MFDGLAVNTVATERGISTIEQVLGYGLLALNFMFFGIFLPAYDKRRRARRSGPPDASWLRLDRKAMTEAEALHFDFRIDRLNRWNVTSMKWFSYGCGVALVGLVLVAL